MAKPPKPAEQSGAAVAVVSSEAVEGADQAPSNPGSGTAHSEGPGEADEAVRRVADLSGAVLADPAAAMAAGVEVAVAVDGEAAVLADAALGQTLHYATRKPSDAEIRAAIAEYFDIPETDILAWNVETGRVVTIDGRKLTPDMPGTRA